MKGFKRAVLVTAALIAGGAVAQAGPGWGWRGHEGYARADQTECWGKGYRAPVRDPANCPRFTAAAPDARGTMGRGPGFVDENKNGICDYREGVTAPAPKSGTDAK